MDNIPQHIDAVITWVDGNDENHYRKRQKILLQYENKSENELVTGRDHTRFVDNGELKFCIESIRKFAPWIRTIHLVTDNQKPKFLTEEYKNTFNVNLIDHNEIFRDYEWALPTFNTRTIESALWRINNLAKFFIYFNDDFVLTSHVKPEHFFPDGKVLLRGKWNTIKQYGALRIKLNEIGSFLSKKFLGITRSMHLLQQIKSAQLAGFEKRYYRTSHVPHPVVLSSLEEFFSENMDLFESNIQFKFRNMEQYSAIFLGHHLEISKDNAVLQRPNDYLMLNGELDMLFTLKSKLKKIRRGDAKFICIQGYEKYSRLNQKRIREVLEAVLDIA